MTQETRVRLIITVILGLIFGYIIAPIPESWTTFGSPPDMP